MAKREIPLFIIDNSRAHKKGECDFLVCTDSENGFVAKIDYVQGVVDEVGEMYRIGYGRNGLSRRIAVQRLIGSNPNPASVKTLLKKGFDYFVKESSVSVNMDKPSKEECIKFLDVYAKANRQAVDDAGVDYQSRMLALKQATILEATINYLKDGRE